MSTETQPPRNWGDWRQCKSCLVVQPPRALGPDEICVDKAWCQRIRHSSKPKSNGNGNGNGGSHSIWAGELPVFPVAAKPEKVASAKAASKRPRVTRKKK